MEVSKALVSDILSATLIFGQIMEQIIRAVIKAFWIKFKTMVELGAVAFGKVFVILLHATIFEPFDFLKNH